MYLCFTIKHRIYSLFTSWLRFICVNFLPRRYYIKNNTIYVSVLFVQEAGKLKRYANGDETTDKTFLRRDPLLLVKFNYLLYFNSCM